MNLTVLTPPISTCDSALLATVKQHARIDINDDDSLITAYIGAARQASEAYTKRTLCTTQYQLSLERFPYNYPLSYFLPQSLERVPNQFWGRIELWTPPVISVDSIRYIDTGGTLQPLATNAYQVESGGQLQTTITPTSGSVFPSTRYQLGGVLVTYTAGYGPDLTSAPSGVQVAISLLAAHFYRNREAVSETSMSEIPFGVRALLDTVGYGSYV